MKEIMRLKKLENEEKSRKWIGKSTRTVGAKEKWLDDGTYVVVAQSFSRVLKDGIENKYGEQFQGGSETRICGSRTVPSTWWKVMDREL